MKARDLYLAGAVALALSGCMSAGPSSAPIARAPVSGVEGNWFDAKGIKSSFNGGVFETRTTDNNQKLAEGSYTMADASKINITVVSLVRNTTSSVDCALVSSSQLNCTTSAGQNFVLTRGA